MVIVTILIVVIVLLVAMLFNPSANRIREVQNLLNKDRSVCDFINELDGWSISPMEINGLKILINSPMGVYPLYITYNGERPSNDEVKELHAKMTSEYSDVTRAHESGYTYEAYMERRWRRCPSRNISDY